MVQQQRIHYGWIVVGVTFLTLLLGAGVRSTPGILMVPFEDEFHWTRSTISFAVAVNLIIYGLIGPFAAAMMERFGVRRLMLAAIVCIATGVALTTFMRESWQLILLWGVVVGCGTGTTANVLAATVATRWFTKNRGLVVGLLSSAAAAGQLVFLPAMAAIVTTYGWRPMVLSITVFAALIFPIVAFLMRDRPEDIGLAPYGETGGARQTVRTAGNPALAALRILGEGLRRRDFWLLAGSFFTCPISSKFTTSIEKPRFSGHKHHPRRTSEPGCRRLNAIKKSCQTDRRLSRCGPRLQRSARPRCLGHRTYRPSRPIWEASHIPHVLRRASRP
jgi:MFS family permease